MKQNFKCLLRLFLSLCLLCAFTPMAMAEGLTILPERRMAAHQRHLHRQRHG